MRISDWSSTCALPICAFAPCWSAAMPCGAMTASDRPPPATIANFARNFISGLHHEQRHSLPPGATLLSYLQTAIGQPADAVPHEPWLLRLKRRPEIGRAPLSNPVTNAHHVCLTLPAKKKQTTHN